MVDYEAFGENVDEDNNEQFGKNQNSFELSLYAQKYFDELNLLSSDDQEQYKTKDKYNEFFYCEDLFDYVNNSALSWDYVEAGTFADQEQGYYRLQPFLGGFFSEFLILKKPAGGCPHPRRWHWKAQQKIAFSY